jgi:hypothetical protein
MSMDRLGELLETATAEVPLRYQSPSLADIHRRVRRRRATLAATASAVLVVAVLGALGIARAMAGGPGLGQLPAGPAAPWTPSPVAPSVAGSEALAPTDPTALPWLSAMVSRDDRTVTVHTGAGSCKQLVSPRADATVQEAGQVVIAVHANVIDSADCTANTDSLQLAVTLSADLGTRTVRDAATGAGRTVFRERDLPQLPAAQWSPVPVVSWPSNNPGWVSSYNGPHGGEIELTASPGTGPADPGGAATTVRLGTRQGLVTGTDKVTWQADWSTYTLEYIPGEGGSMTLDNFKQLLAALTWS